MNYLNDISDEKSVPFLHSLGVETYKKSFEWMLHDSVFAAILKWLYVNLDHNNALNAREEYRYAEIEKKKCLLQPDEFEASILSIQEQFVGICLPGDHYSLENVKCNINMQKERLAMLKKHEKIVNAQIKQNNIIKEELDIEATKLSAVQRQFSEDETALAEQCLALSEEVDNIVDSVCDMIDENLNICEKSCKDKEIASKFLAFGPFKSYRRTQALFMSHFDLYVLKRFGHKQASNVTDRMFLKEARNMQERLIDTVYAYISTKVELCGVQSIWALVANYNDVHPSKVLSCTMEAQSTIEMLDQEESILYQQLHVGIKSFVSLHTNLTLESIANTALNIREEVYKDLAFLLDTTQQAFALDYVLCHALKKELCTLEEKLNFALHFLTYVRSESEAVCSRIQSMNEIWTEQGLVEQSLQSSNILQNALCSIFSVEVVNDPDQPVRLYSEVKNLIRDLNDNVTDGFENKEKAISDYKQLNEPLREYIWDGCTKQPNCSDVAVASMTHQLRREMDAVDAEVLATSERFTTVKNGDKRNLRKFWQWFLVDQAKLLSVIKTVQSNGFI